ncbi:ABC-type nitrate/sulfonate/bicarbonate transport system, substrate-binding protein [Seinonella peptonophila]|uniref:ABC-type nitrate/sulfonate/bicarbonate transport system, substrate-binding protein n=1 Tax=Seinonella peptonophila TaxID=112248 RepID=A0A1M4TY04_9BACL|nr:ABC transporter substrate-binding protein [Seinonella peptonophila]SHE49308.1 ABC-type nitrate/sulfonate/bicarbonate transport system, substrate-binding protein [Seinonella peptonophila]
MKKWSILVLIFAFAISMVGCSSGSESGDLTKVNVGLMPYYDYSPLAFAEEKGFFKAEGIDFKSTMFPVEGNVAPALVQGSIDIGAFSDTPSITLASQFPDLEMVSFHNVFKGFAIVGRKGSKTYDQLIKEGKDGQAAAVELGKQLKGKSIITTSGASFYMVIEQALKNAGLSKKDVKIIDMEPDQGASAFISGTGDFYLGGLPQREKLEQEGYPAIISGDQIGSGAVILAGLASTKKFVSEHPEVIQKMEKVWFKTLDYMQKHPDEAYKFVADWSNKQSGGKSKPADVKKFFTDYITFAHSKAEAQKLFYDPNSPTNWKKRYENLIQYHEESKEIKKGSVKLDQLVPAEKIFSDLK